MLPDTLLQTADHANGSSAPSSLMQALRFTEADLQANRQRRLGRAQADVLRSRLKGQVVIGLLMASLPISFVMMSLITLGAAGELTAPSDPTAFGLMMVILSIAALSGLVLLGFILQNWRWQLRAFNEGSVLSAEGVVDIAGENACRLRYGITWMASTLKRRPGVRFSRMMWWFWFWPRP